MNLFNNTTYTYKQVFEYCYKHKIRTPAKVLFEWGEKIGWRKRNGDNFKDLAAFINAYNSIWIKLYGKTQKGYWKNKKKDL